MADSPAAPLTQNGAYPQTVLHRLSLLNPVTENIIGRTVSGPRAPQTLHSAVPGTDTQAREQRRRRGLGNTNETGLERP